MRHPVRVYVQDHSFGVTDRDVDTPFEAMDYSTGLAGVMDSAALIATGVDRGYVEVTADALHAHPGLYTGEQWNDLASWEDIAEISLYVPNGHLTVEQLELPQLDERPQLPVLSADGPGYYRLRMHASGRDRHYDKVVDQSGERFHFLAWPAPPEAPLIMKAASWCGYGLRLGALNTPAPVAPSPVIEDEAEAQRQAMQQRNLLGG
ncbi:MULTISPECIES: hypothetical protein [Micromonospora]|uniref:hypothetical protein n=1 Tax=Micromonospora TaxID=1873 RepID=UPI001B372CB1|nr:hypothetical protein [Micromonospora sp. C81]MBQ1040818.1 hypothetical protein [Micromonospora sp. C81]WTI22273.1 hypothetical protein OG886_03985 [Micromonospora zamorensis]